LPGNLGRNSDTSDNESVSGKLRLPRRRTLAVACTCRSNRDRDVGSGGLTWEHRRILLIGPPGSAGTLVGTDQLRPFQNMPVHRAQEIGLRGTPQILQLRVQRVELVDVAVPTHRRTWPAIARPLPIVEPLARSRR
jgi:hypothetical protein